MIITSNSVEHNYTIPNLSIIGEVDGLQKVAYQAQIYLHSSTTFDHTYETTIYDVDSLIGITTIVTESKTVTEFTYYNVDFDTDSIDSSSFTSWEDLEEDQVLQWCFNADENTLQTRESMELKVLEAKDKILNPLKYYRDSPPTPWRIRADQASVENN
jgi:hypothetical protein